MRLQVPQIQIPSIERTKKGTFLVVDVGDRSFKYALCERGREGVHVLMLQIEDLELSSADEVVSAAFSTVTELFKNIEDVIFTFTPRYLKAHTKTISFSRAVPQSIINTVEESDIEKRITQQAKEEIHERIVEQSGISSSEFQAIEMQITERTIEGYKVPRLSGFRGQRIECTVRGSFLLASAHIILEELARRSHRKMPTVRHLADAVEQFGIMTGKDGVYLDMGSHSTQMIGVTNGKVVCLDEIPFGGDDFIQTIEKSLGMRKNTAQELKEQYANGQVTIELQQKMRNMMLPEARKFASTFQKKLQEISVILPPEIFLFGGGSRLPEIAQAVEEMNFQTLPFIDKPEVRMLFPKDLSTFRGGHDLANPRLTPLFLLVYAVAYAK